MNLPYGLRLLLLSSASFFVVYCAASLAVSALVPAVLRRLGSQTASRQSAVLAGLRLLPAALALFGVAAFCVPGYLRFEPEADAERAGALSILAALLGAAIWMYGLVRAALAVRRACRTAAEFRRAGEQIRLPGEDAPVTVVGSDAPLVALTGVARPRVVVSRGMLRALSREQLDAALRHEQAHRAAHDNGKRLLFLLSPDPFAPLGRLAALECAWARVAEWAADDRAAAGEPERALTLAETLVRVARMGRPPATCLLAAQLINDGRGLRERVERLVDFASQPPAPRAGAIRPSAPLWVLTAVALLAAAWQSPVLYSAHRLLEVFLR